MSQVIGSIDWADNVRFSFNDKDISGFTKPYCDHCHANHNLRYTYIVELDDGSLIQAGYNCLADILGYEPVAEHILRSRDEFMNYMNFGSYNCNELDTKKVLRLLLAYLDFSGKETYLKSVTLSTIRENTKFMEHYKSLPEDFTETDKIINFYSNFESSNEFKSNVKNLVTEEYFSARYFNIFKYCVKIYLDEINFKPAYTSVRTTYDETTVKSIEQIRISRFGGYNWKAETPIYRLIDTLNNVFEFGTSKTDLPQAGDKISFKYKYLDKELDIKDISYNRNYGWINKIKCIKKIA